MQAPLTWIWQQPDWPRFTWDGALLAPTLGRARLAQGKVLGSARLLDADLTREAVAAILVEDGLTTSAIEGERLDLEAVRSSVARRLGLPTAGLPVRTTTCVSPWRSRRSKNRSPPRFLTRCTQPSRTTSRPTWARFNSPAVCVRYENSDIRPFSARRAEARRLR